MNLHQLIQQYVAYRQALGERFQNSAQILRAFGRVIGASADIADVRAEQVSAFLAGSGPLTRYWHEKHNALVGFYRYATSRGYATKAPLPAVVPKRPPPFVPYIYSQEELRRLLDATASYQRHRSSMEPVTMRTIVLLLYATALRVREALDLNRANIDQDNAVLTVKQSKFEKSRLVPFARQLSPVLAGYSGRPQARCSFDPAQAPFFTTRTGRRVKQITLEASFRRLCEHAGIRRWDGASYQPRLHDLRHTFAVQRLTSWYRQGMDVQRLLPRLSVYLGHACLAATVVYLSMTPELLQQANKRFEHYVWEEDSYD